MRLFRIIIHTFLNGEHILKRGTSLERVQDLLPLKDLRQANQKSKIGPQHVLTSHVGRRRLWKALLQKRWEISAFHRSLPQHDRQKSVDKLVSWELSKFPTALHRGKPWRPAQDRKLHIGTSAAEGEGGTSLAAEAAEEQGEAVKKRK